jgi:hypothetical protein
MISSFAVSLAVLSHFFPPPLLLSQKVNADESCYLYKSTTLVIIKYEGTSDGCFAETDSMIKSGFRIASIVGDMNGYNSVYGRVYLTKSFSYN